MIRVKYEHLLGRPHVWGSTDCFGLARDFYYDNWGIEIRDYARADGWEKGGKSLIVEHMFDEGFSVVNEPITAIKPGDALLVAIGPAFANHIGIFLGNDDNGRGWVLDHLRGKLSRKRPFSGIFRNQLCAHVRHPDVVVSDDRKPRYLLDLLPKHKRDEIEQYLKTHPIQADRGRQESPPDSNRGGTDNLST